MIHLSSHSLSGSQSVARNGGGLAKLGGEIPVMRQIGRSLMVGTYLLFDIAEGDIMRRKNHVEMLRSVYPPGTRVCLHEMIGEPQMTDGLTGTVQCVDDRGSIHVKWDNGSTLALLQEEDVQDMFEIIKDEQMEQRLE